MTIPTPAETPLPRKLWRSMGAVLLGFFAVAILSLATDQVLHVLKVYPPWGEPMYSPGLNLLALAYRIVYTILGGYIAARLAPRNPMRHVLVLAIIGLIMGISGVIATSGLDLGPRWYPIALAATALPCTLLGGVLHRRMPPNES
jgi:H+/Cl- antiporter ClcA